MVSLPSPPTPTSSPPASSAPEPSAHALDALSDQDNRWLDAYTSSICDFDPVRLGKETNQSMSQVLCWLQQPHIQAALELFDKVAREGFQRRALAARMTALNTLDYLQDRITDLVELRRALALIARFIQPPRTPRPPRGPDNPDDPRSRRAPFTSDTPPPVPPNPPDTTSGETDSGATSPSPTAHAPSAPTSAHPSTRARASGARHARKTRPTSSHPSTPPAPTSTSNVSSASTSASSSTTNPASSAPASTSNASPASTQTPTTANLTAESPVPSSSAASQPNPPATSPAAPTPEFSNSASPAPPNSTASPPATPPPETSTSSSSSNPPAPTSPDPPLLAAPTQLAQLVIPPSRLTHDPTRTPQELFAAIVDVLMNSDFPYPGSGISTLADMLAPDATVDNYPIPVFVPPPAGSPPVLDFTLAKDFHNFALLCDGSNIFNTLICVPMVHTFHPRGDLNGDHYCIRMRMAHITEFARGYHDHYYRPHMVTFHAKLQSSGPRANEWLISAVHATH